jgi:hypothetical protein
MATLLIAVSTSACGTGSQAESPNTRSACAEVLHLNHPGPPKAHSVGVLIWPPNVGQLLTQSGSLQLEKVENDLVRDKQINRDIRETAAWESAVKYCQSIGQ